MAGPPRVAECVIQLIGARQIVSAASLQDAPANPPLADAVQQPASSEPSFASIACKPGIDGVLPSIVGGQGLAGMSANFTGVNYNTDETLPGAVLSLIGQRMVIRDSTFSNLVNVASGSLIVENSDLVIMNTTFSSNSQAASGALYLNSSRVTVYNSLFDRNRGFQAGGITAIGATSLLVNLTVFRFNNGSQACHGTPPSGGAIGMSPQSVGGNAPQLQVVDSLFMANTAVNGAGAFVQRASLAAYINCTFAGNIASGNGAAVFQEATPGSLTRCTLANGRAQVGGGAYYNRCSKMVWTGNLFENNTARSGSAGMELNQCSGDIRQSTFFKNRGEKGGGIFMDQSAISVLNCTFSGNSASLLGGALYRSSTTHSSDVRGCSFLKNSAGQFGGAIYEQMIDSGSIKGCSFGGNTAPNAPALCTRLSSTEVAADNIALNPADIQYMDH
ncbi:g8744 [Coccomyxa viridis]|uniref:G8744 protein n=1 Tax=Coccomyxa viridis TaxID=1274662 RepID=A0ABP1G153_9CHLO